MSEVSGVGTARRRAGAPPFFSPLIALAAARGRVIGVAAGGIVIVLLAGLLLRTSSFDFGIVKALNAQHHGAIGSLADAVYKYVGPLYAIIATVLLTVILLLVSRSLSIASTFAVTIAVTWLPLAVIKLIFDRLRPDSSLLPFPFNPAQDDASYPSGHAAFITALVVVVVLGFATTRARVLAGIIGGIVVLVVGVALVTDGVHFPTDVAASILWSITVAPLVRMLWVLILRALTRAQARRRPALD